MCQRRISHLLLKNLGQTLFITHPKPTPPSLSTGLKCFIVCYAWIWSLPNHTLCSTQSPVQLSKSGQTRPVQVCRADPQPDERACASPLPCDLFGKSPGSSQQNFSSWTTTTSPHLLSVFKCSAPRIGCLKSCNQAPAIRQALGDNRYASSKPKSNGSMATWRACRMMKNTPHFKASTSQMDATVSV